MHTTNYYMPFMWEKMALLQKIWGNRGCPNRSPLNLSQGLAIHAGGLVHMTYTEILRTPSIFLNRPLGGDAELYHGQNSNRCM